MHAPDEKFHLPNLHRGTEASIRLLERIGRMERGIHLSPSRPS